MTDDEVIKALRDKERELSAKAAGLRELANDLNNWADETHAAAWQAEQDAKALDIARLTFYG